jgi:sterol desaturase/sphingolipid hydroxylase (fatty acid hydroxylase superfamily)
MPHWVGYGFQRPEMHRIHHDHGRHRDDYGDIVLWDMLFGAWRNPRTWDGACGFTPEREERLTDMPRLRNVHRESGAP